MPHSTVNSRGPSLAAAPDAANRFIGHGQIYLAYGLGATATWVLGLPHGLAVLHGKTRRGGLVFDAADLVKDAVILQAFLWPSRATMNNSSGGGAHRKRHAKQITGFHDRYPQDHRYHHRATRDCPPRTMNVLFIAQCNKRALTKPAASSTSLPSGAANAPGKRPSPRPGWTPCASCCAKQQEHRRSLPLDFVGATTQ